MNLDNINFKDVFDHVKILEHKTRFESLAVDCGKLLKIIQAAKTIFSDGFKIKFNDQWYSELSLQTIIEAKDKYIPIQLSFDSAESETCLTYSFDEEFGIWVCMFKPKSSKQDIIFNLLLTLKISPLLGFEFNLASFKVVELAYSLRKA